MCVCTSMFGYVYIQVQLPMEVISECQITLELEFHATVIYLAWALGADLWPLAGAASVLFCSWVISPSPNISYNPESFKAMSAFFQLLGNIEVYSTYVICVRFC